MSKWKHHERQSEIHKKRHLRGVRARIKIYFTIPSPKSAKCLKIRWKGVSLLYIHICIWWVMGAVSCYMFIYSSVIVADAINWNGFVHTILSYLCHSRLLSVFSICSLRIELFVEKSFMILIHWMKKARTLSIEHHHDFQMSCIFENKNDRKAFFILVCNIDPFRIVNIYHNIWNHYSHMCWICDVASWMLIWCHVLIIFFWIRLTDASFSHRFIHLLFAVCHCIFAKRIPHGPNPNIIRLWSNTIVHGKGMPMVVQI